MRKFFIDLLSALYPFLAVISFAVLAYQVYEIINLLGFRPAFILGVSGLFGIIITFGIVGLLVEIEHAARVHFIALKQEIEKLKA